jgi:hypothetical protein
MAEPPQLPILAEFAPIPRWREISGMSRSKTYEELGVGNLRGVKCGRQILIDVRHGLEYMRSLPQAQIRPRTTPKRRRPQKEADTVAAVPTPAALPRQPRALGRRGMESKSPPATTRTRPAAKRAARGPRDV